jgi:hypothetical protein
MSILTPETLSEAVKALRNHLSTPLSFQSDIVVLPPMLAELLQEKLDAGHEISEAWMLALEEYKTIVEKGRE